MSETDTSALEELLRPLADGTRAEFLAEIRQLSLHQDDDELFKLLKILSLYAEFYQTIPAAIREVHYEAISRTEALAATTGAVGHQDDPQERGQDHCPFGRPQLESTRLLPWLVDHRRHRNGQDEARPEQPDVSEGKATRSSCNPAQLKCPC